MSENLKSVFVSKTKIIFTENDFILDQNPIQSQEFRVEDSLWQVVIETRIKDLHLWLVSGLRLISAKTPKLFGNFETFLLDLNHEKRLKTEEINVDFSCGQNRISFLQTFNTFIQQKDVLIPNKRLKIGIRLTLFSDCEPRLEMALLYRNTFNIQRINDFKIICGEKEFFVSKAILSSRSLLFKQLFIQRDVTSYESEAKPEVMQELLKFLYCLKSEVFEDYCEDLLSLSYALKVWDLFKICENLIFTEIGVKNAIKLLKLFHRFDCRQSFDKTLEFVAKNTEQIVTSSGDQWFDFINENQNDLVQQVIQKRSELVDFWPQKRRRLDNQILETFTYHNFYYSIN